MPKPINRREFIITSATMIVGTMGLSTLLSADDLKKKDINDLIITGSVDYDNDIPLVCKNQYIELIDYRWTKISSDITFLTKYHELQNCTGKVNLSLEGYNSAQESIFVSTQTYPYKEKEFEPFQLGKVIIKPAESPTRHFYFKKSEIQDLKTFKLTLNLRDMKNIRNT